MCQRGFIAPQGGLESLREWNGDGGGKDMTYKRTGLERGVQEEEVTRRRRSRGGVVFGMRQPSGEMAARTWQR